MSEVNDSVIAEFELEMYGQYMFEKGMKEGMKRGQKKGEKKGEKKGRKEAQIRIATKMLERVKDGEKIEDIVAQLLDLDILQESIDAALKNLGLVFQAD